MSGDQKDRPIVRSFLARTCGVTLTDVQPRHAGKSVDFEMIDSGERILVAELKTLRPRRPSPENGWIVEIDADGIQEAQRPHNGPARIAKIIATAHQQLSDYPHPWALILLNMDHFIDVGDFFEAFTGERVLGEISGRRVINVASRGIALGHTLATRYEIDLYMWVDPVRMPAFCVWWSTPV